jgi:hypothetical protein
MAPDSLTTWRDGPLRAGKTVSPPASRGLSPTFGGGIRPVFEKAWNSRQKLFLFN